MTDLDPEQVIAMLCAKVTSALPPLSVNSHLNTSLPPPWTEGKPHPLSGTLWQAGAETEPTHLFSSAQKFSSSLASLADKAKPLSTDKS